MLSDFIPQAVQQRIRYFIDEIFLPNAITVWPGQPPKEMEDGPWGEGGWWCWKPCESPVTAGDILELEEKIGAPLPPLFRAWFMYKCVLMTDFGWIRLPDVISDDPFQWMWLNVEMMDSQAEYFRGRNIVPFADDGNDAGPVCFDLTRPLPDGDYPVLLFDHEMLDRPDYKGIEIAASFSDLLQKIEDGILEFIRERDLPQQ